MIDFYKRLNLPERASEQQIRSALATAAPNLRQGAQAILLDPRRRRVYDRNRELLLTIGQLRFDLGLNYTRFWSRRQFKDFWKMPAFPFASEPAQAPKRRVDKMMIAQAFHTARHHSRHHAARWGWLWALAAFVLVAAGFLIILWHASF